MEYILATITSLVIISIVYTHSTWKAIGDCYRMWLTKEYWTNYNVIEAISWFAKAIIIVPALIFGINIWELYILALITSITLIWASNKKLLPTLVAFNSLWIWLSCMVIFQNIY